MPTISKYVEIAEGQLKTIAQHIEAWIKKTGSTHADFADRYNELKEQRCPPGSVAPMDRFRVLSFLNLAKGKASKHVARVPRCREIELIALVIGVPVEQLVGEESEATKRMVNVAASSSEAAAFLELMESRQAKTRELIGLAEFLPCSLETPEFMHAHHRTIFAGNAGDIQVWDGIGNARRNELLPGTAKRKWRMTQLNFLSDLKAIASGQGHYESIEPSARKACLKNLIHLLSTPRLDIRMLIADDENDDVARALRKDIAAFDSIITWDEHLGIVRDRWGIAYYSEKKRYTGYWRGLQKEFIDLATFSTLKGVIETIEGLCKLVPVKKENIATVRSSTKNRGSKDQGSAWARQQ